MFKKIIAVLAVFIFITFSSYWVGYSFGKEKDPMYKELDIFAESLAIVEKKHVNEKKPQELIRGALTGMLSSLDDYSQFLSPDEYKELLTETEGQFGGLGIEIALRDGLLTVVTAMEDTPASQAGLESGDIIVKIDGELTKGIAINDAVKKLRGNPGTKVKVTLLKDKSKEIKDVSITRAIIKVKDIKRAEVVENDIGYIKIAEFRENTAKDLDKAIVELQNKKIKGIIIDVRNNPGGLLFSAIEVSSRFLPDDKVVVSTRTRGEEEKFYKSVSVTTHMSDIPAVVLISKGSASGSEILAAALRENNRAVLVGKTTFGKGSVQTIIPLSDGSALRLTTSKYYTPKGICIQDKGITPDVEVENADESKESEKELTAEAKQEKEDAVFNKVADKALGKTSIDQPEEEKVVDDKAKFDYKKDAQLMRALDVLKGLMVVSGSDKK
jgi:carboxyl-terminal processing protease